MNFIRISVLILSGILGGILFNGCSYGGYCIGSRIDKSSEDTIFVHRTPIDDSTRTVLANIRRESEWDVHLKNGETFAAAFAGINFAGDTISFHIDNQIKNLPTNSLNYIAKKNLRPATKIGVIVGIAVDLIIIVEVIRLFTAQTYTPLTW